MTLFKLIHVLLESFTRHYTWPRQILHNQLSVIKKIGCRTVTSGRVCAQKGKLIGEWDTLRCNEWKSEIYVWYARPHFSSPDAQL